MKLVSIPANPVPDGVVTGAIKTSDGVNFALCALGAAAGPQGHGRRHAGPRGIHREIFRDRARSARARICGRDVRLARAGSFRPQAVRSPQGLREKFLRTTSPTSKRSWSRWSCPTVRRRFFALGHSMGGAVAIRACHDGSRWFERIVLSAPMIALAGRPADPCCRAARTFHAAVGTRRRLRSDRRFRRRRAPKVSSAMC